jgi:hypothetical protein
MKIFISLIALFFSGAIFADGFDPPNSNIDYTPLISFIFWYVIFVGIMYRLTGVFGVKTLTDKYMPVLVDEVIISELKGDAFNSSPNIFARFFATIQKIIAWLLGVPKIAHIIVTNKRVIVVEARKFLWFFTWSVVSNSYASNNIVKHGYAMLRSYIFFRSHYLIFGTVGENLYIKSDQGKVKVDEVNQAIAKLTS